MLLSACLDLALSDSIIAKAGLTCPSEIIHNGSETGIRDGTVLLRAAFVRGSRGTVTVRARRTSHRPGRLMTGANERGAGGGGRHGTPCALPVAVTRLVTPCPEAASHGAVPERRHRHSRVTLAAADGCRKMAAPSGRRRAAASPAGRQGTATSRRAARPPVSRPGPVGQAPIPDPRRGISADNKTLHRRSCRAG